jgi:CDP-4-dehydro-6-deoxyglucose reductase, E1
MESREKLRSKIRVNVKKYYESFLSQPRGDIPVSGKKFDVDEIYAIVDAALDGWWTEGRVTLGFERIFSKYIGVKNTIVVNSGSSANLIALAALTSRKLGGQRLKKGDEVITVAAAFPTTINPIMQLGMVPVFCDVKLGTYNIDVNHLKKALSKRSGAIFLAHTMGNPFNLDEVTRFCEKYNLWLIEDSCDALGSTYGGRKIGSFGDISTFSFYPAHHITMGEGGAVVTENQILAQIARSIRDWGRDCWCRTGVDNTCGRRYSGQYGRLPEGYDHKYVYSEVGYNLKNTDLNVAIGTAQMKKLPQFIRARRRNYKLLADGLRDIQEYLILPQPEKNSNPSWFGFPLTLTDKCDLTRQELLKYLNAKGIGTRLLFAGNIIKQPYFIDSKAKFRVAKDLRNTEKIMEKTFWVGLNPLVSKSMTQKIVKTIKQTI